MIRFADHSQQQELKKIWQICFGDELDYIDLFFKCRFDPDKTLVYMLDQTITAMLFLLPADLSLENSLFKAQYIYAACTLPEYRGKGYMRELIDFAVEHGNTLGRKYSMLVPATRKLFDFYTKIGFQSFFRRKEVVLSRNQLEKHATFSANSRKINTDEIIDVQKEAFSGKTFVHWDKESIDYSLQELFYWSGRAIGIENNLNKLVGYALCKYVGNAVMINELGVKPQYFHLVAGAMLSTFPSEKFIFKLPADFPPFAPSEATVYSGMIRPANSCYGALLKYNQLSSNYIGFTLE